MKVSLRTFEMVNDPVNRLQLTFWNTRFYFYLHWTREPAQIGAACLEWLKRTILWSAYDNVKQRIKSWWVLTLVFSALRSERCEAQCAAGLFATDRPRPVLPEELHRQAEAQSSAGEDQR